ncbi:MAG: hypothetical protein JWR56_2993 [Massilia sp.]|jgi:hypothetical protein|nr:hypothetical protein [Massilia sp.]
MRKAVSRLPPAGHRQRQKAGRGAPLQEPLREAVQLPARTARHNPRQLGDEAVTDNDLLNQHVLLDTIRLDGGQAVARGHGRRRDCRIHRGDPPRGNAAAAGGVFQRRRFLAGRRLPPLSQLPRRWRGRGGRRGAHRLAATLYYTRSAPTPLTACAASTKHAQGFPSAVAKVPGAPCSATPAEIVWIR